MFPLYLYNQKTENLLDNETPPERVPNFNMEVIAEVEKKLKMKLVAGNDVGTADLLSLQERQKDNQFTPEDLFDYIYAVLHSKSYREKFKEFLKINFPKVPFNC